MTDDYAIEVHNVSKRYHIHQLKQNQGRRWLPSIGDALRWLDDKRQGTTAGDENWIWALRDVSFSVPRGQSWGVIGRNGSGKSTLLKLIASVTVPTSGTLSRRGSLSAMLSAGTGFNPELTGRENVYLNAAILGIRRRDIDAVFEDIIDFSGIRPFIDTPVKRYSSGMRVRLAFSIAVNLNPDILLVDEVLTVGDYEFRRKSLERMKQFRARQDRTVLLVSHNLSVVKAFCEQAVWLDKGQTRAIGDVDDVIRAYLQEMRAARVQSTDEAGLRHDTTGRVQITGLDLLDGDGQRVDNVMHGEPLTLRFTYEATSVLTQPEFVVNVVRVQDNVTATRFHSANSAFDVNAIDGKGRFEVTIPNVWLMPGEYNIVATILSERVIHDRAQGFPTLTIVPGPLLAAAKYKFDSSDMVMSTPVQWKVATGLPETLVAE